jgi:hypothetical protein
MFAGVSTDGGQTWQNLQVSQNASSAILNGGNNTNDYGDYIGLAFSNGFAHLGWTDNSKDIASTNPDSPNFDIGSSTITGLTTGGGGGGGGGAISSIPGDHDTSDAAAQLGVLSGAKSYPNLSLASDGDGLPDYLWARWTAGLNGTFTATVSPAASAGALEVHLFTVKASGALEELQHTDQVVQGTMTVSARMATGEPILVEVKGKEISLGVFGQGAFQLDVNMK